MITVNGTTWTDPSEAITAHEYFFGKYGKDVAEPVCEYCGKTTCYIVEQAKIARDGNGKVISVKFIKKGVRQVVATTSSRTLIKGDLVYIPVFVCESCGARGDAMTAFKAQNCNAPNLDKRCMLEEEKRTYRHVFAGKIVDLEKKKNDAEAMKPNLHLGDK